MDNKDKSLASQSQAAQPSESREILTAVTSTDRYQEIARRIRAAAENKWNDVFTIEMAELIEYVAHLAGQSQATKVQAEPVAASGQEIGWCLERGPASAPRYLHVDGGMFDWTLDHMKAIRFSRRADAEQVAEIVEDADRVAEHMWLAAAPAAPTAQEVTQQAAKAEFNEEHMAHLINRLSVANRREGWRGMPEYSNADLERAKQEVNSAERKLLEYVRSLAPTTSTATASGSAQAGPAVAWIATDMDGRADVGLTKEEAKRRVICKSCDAATTASASDALLEQAARICDQAAKDAFAPAAAELAAEGIRALKGRASAPSQEAQAAHAGAPDDRQIMTHASMLALCAADPVTASGLPDERQRLEQHIRMAQESGWQPGEGEGYQSAVEEAGGPLPAEELMRIGRKWMRGKNEHRGVNDFLFTRTKFLKMATEVIAASTKEAKPESKPAALFPRCFGMDCFCNGHFIASNAADQGEKNV